MANWFYKMLGLPPNKTRSEVDRIERLRVEHRARAGTLAIRMGIIIPSSTHVPLWSLPILERLVERVERLERDKGNAKP